jgi:hypothetical protein
MPKPTNANPTSGQGCIQPMNVSIKINNKQKPIRFFKLEIECKWLKNYYPLRKFKLFNEVEGI